MASHPDKPVAKSLHTISVLVNVARLQIAHGFFTPDGSPSNDRAIGQAMATLGLAGRPDPYGLEVAALRQLDKESAQ